MIPERQVQRSQGPPRGTAVSTPALEVAPSKVRVRSTGSTLSQRIWRSNHRHNGHTELDRVIQQTARDTFELLPASLSLRAARPVTRSAWPPESLGPSKVRSAQAAWYKPAASDRSRRDYRGDGSTREDAPRLIRGSPSTGVQRDKFSLVAARNDGILDKA